MKIKSGDTVIVIAGKDKGKTGKGSIDASNVMYFDTKVNKPSKIGYTLEGDKKVRISKKSGSKIDK